MSPSDKRNMVHSLCTSVMLEVMSRVGEMPEEWDGIELRRLIADKFAYEAEVSDKLMDRARKRSYQNIAHERALI